MGDLFNDYEKQFSLLTADIVAKTNQIPNVFGGVKHSVVNDVEQKFDDAQELLEQMDLEVRSLAGDHKVKCGSKLRSYKEEIKNLETNFKKAKISLTDQEHARAELLAGDDVQHSEDQRSRLLNNTERMERSERLLNDGYRVCIETEQLGQDILQNLGRDREKMTNTRDRLRNADSNLNKSSRILTGMMRRVVQNRIVLALVCLAILATICLVIYYTARKT